jgi:hypothetical protein
MVENNMTSNIEQNMSLSSESIISFCQFLAKEDWAFIQVGIVKETAMKIIMDVKVSFSDQIAIFGKY